MELVFEGEVLADEMSLAEQGVQDRDKLVLRPRMATQPTSSSVGPSNSGSALEAALATLQQANTVLDSYEEKVLQRVAVHQANRTQLK